MEQRNDSMRERLLARLPQPENVAAYREEVAGLLAKHEKALATGRWATRLLWLCAVCVLVVSDSIWGPRLDPMATEALHFLAALMAFAGAMMSLEFLINRSKVDLLKEVKQVQLQVLELQASLRKDVEH
jgi:hypothetical protein